MRRLYVFSGVTLAVALAACGGTGDKKGEGEATGAASAAASVAVGTASDAGSSAVPSGSASVTPPPATPTATTAASSTPPPVAPTVAATRPPVVLAAGNRCREIETTDWQVSFARGTVAVSGKAHLKTGGWKIELVDRGQTAEAPKKQFFELVATKGGGAGAIGPGIKPISGSKVTAAAINRAEVLCGPNRVVLLRI